MPFVSRITILSVFISLCYSTTWAEQDMKEPFEVGQRWVYKHEGPRPGSIEPNDIDGERIIQVIGVVEQPKSKRWIIEDRFTKGVNAVARFHVNEKRLTTSLEIENEKSEVATLIYDPPIPYQIMEMNIGQEKTIETSLKMDSPEFTLPTTIEIRRLDDETITTPAGEFVNCLHFKITTKSIFNIKIAKIPVIEERERWFHPKVNGPVKEVYRKDPVKFLTWSREGYTANSVLTGFSKEDVPAKMGIANQADNPNPNHSQPKASDFSTVYTVFLGTVIALGTGIYILRKRLRRKA